MTKARNVIPQHPNLQWAAISLMFIAIAAGVMSAEDRRTHDNVDKEHLAVQGYDVVSYFDAKQPQKGRADLSAMHNGHTYRFATEANKLKFIAAPQKFVPAYGGWCATAMAEGKKVDVNPANFKITDGRLFLFYKSFFHNAKDDWAKDEANLTRQADERWKRITAK